MAGKAGNIDAASGSEGNGYFSEAQGDGTNWRQLGIEATMAPGLHQPLMNTDNPRGSQGPIYPYGQEFPVATIHHPE